MSFPAATFMWRVGESRVTKQNYGIDPLDSPTRLPRQAAGNDKVEVAQAGNGKN
ncbi:MAG: hypothetical protein QM523_01535 [Candidatus Pacebacteria bacterium]|nr:hypothetical protein [Candidatus Paceibacterota bacterium]